MAQTGYKYPSAATDAGGDWANESNVYTDDTNYASYNELGGQDWLICTGFGFTSGDIASGSSIDSLRPRIHGYGDGAAGYRDIDIAYTIDGSSVFNSTIYLNEFTLPTTVGDQIGTIRLPGSLSYGDVVGNSNFGIMIRKSDTGGDAIYIDTAQIAVRYTAPVPIEGDLSVSGSATVAMLPLLNRVALTGSASTTLTGTGLPTSTKTFSCSATLGAAGSYGTKTAKADITFEGSATLSPQGVGPTHGESETLGSATISAKGTVPTTHTAIWDT